MPVYKGQLLLGTDDAGWSETYWFNEATHAAAMAKLQLIATASMNIRSSLVKSRVCRISDVAIKGDSFLQPCSVAAGTYGGVGVVPFDPAVSLQVNAYSAGHVQWTHLFLRGIPNDQVDVGEPFKLVDPLVPAWAALFATYIAAWKANAMLYSKKPGPGYATVAIDTTGYNRFLVIRKAGRPFALRRGRRVVV